MPIKSKFWVLALGLLASGLASESAFAATRIASFTVSATVVATCSASAAPMGVGTYTAAVANAGSALSVNCDRVTPYTVGVSSGAAAEATVTEPDAGGLKSTASASAMPGRAQFLDSAHILNPVQTVGAETHVKTGSGFSQPHAVYGQTAGMQSMAPGEHPDFITITVTY